jgi:hypothetical protein
MKSKKIKQVKLFYYVRNIFIQLIPKGWHEKQLYRRLQAIPESDIEVLMDRVNYYNKLQATTPLGDKALSLNDINFFRRPREYHFDAFEYIRFFKGDLKANFLFGDITHTEKFPTIQKSRPVNGNNKNAVLMKLNKARHFIFVKDSKPFTSKKNMLIGRGTVTQEHRIRFLNMYFDHPLCDLGQTNKEGGNPKWWKPKISIYAHLDFKFILSLEGNDVATNLKWIMSSNSIAVMPKPKYETWFMEGRLIPDFHYIMISDDYTDLEDKIKFYINNEEAAQAIIRNANNYVKQFRNKKQEDMISLLVLSKYFCCTGQLDKCAPYTLTE